MARQAPLANWKNGTTTTTVCGTDPTPPASMALLWSAEQWPIAVGAMPYPTTAHLVEGNTAAVLTTRRFAVVVAPACMYGRLHVTRCGGSLNFAAQANTTGGSTTSGGYAGASVITAPPGTSGDELYHNAGATPAIETVVLVTSAKPDDTPAASKNRAFQVPEDRVCTVEEFQVTLCAGVGLEITSRTADLETLP
jgi:hypothetical protein